MTPIKQRASAIPAELKILIAAASVVAVGFGIIAPVLPQFADSFGITTTQAAIVVSAFAAFRLLFAPVSGRMVTRFGERSTYVAGLSIVAVSTGACAFAQSYEQLLVFRAFGGIGSTMFTVSAMGLIARLAPADIRGKVNSMYAGAFIIGTMVGPLIGGLLGRYGLRIPFLVYAVGLLISASIVGIKMSNTQLMEAQKRQVALSMSFRQALKDRAYRTSLYSGFMNGWANFGVRMALVPLFVTAVLTTDTAHDLGAFNAGLAMTMFAVGNAVSVSFSGSLSDRLGRRPLLIAGTAVCGVGTIVFGFADTLWLVVALSIVTGLGTGLYFAPLQAALADIVGSARNGSKVIAGQQMSQDFGAIIGPIAAGMLVDHFDYRIAFIVTGAMLTSCTLAWLLSPETKTSTRPSGVCTES